LRNLSLFFGVEKNRRSREEEKKGEEKSRGKEGYALQLLAARPKWDVMTKNYESN
jgi:hypothetical protein